VKPPLITTANALRQALAASRTAGKTIGLVPTMGALHAGHASLLKAARAETGFVTASIFVNPIQFGPAEDLARYPQPLNQDLELCGQEGVDLVFAPDVTTMYSPGFCTYVEVQGLSDGLCGRSRPGHFRGVTTVVLKLFNLVQPDVTYFGQKDAQQARVIQQMVDDLDLPLRLRICPIVREPDGLALSSRNRYLDPGQRRHATVLFRTLQEARALIDGGERDAARVRQQLVGLIAATPGAVLDYVDIVDAITLKPVHSLQGELLVAIAVKFGTTRLIDNIQLSVAVAPDS
jgi:pantoate--beta-alanine ligase